MDECSFVARIRVTDLVADVLEEAQILRSGVSVRDISHALLA